MEEKIRAHIIVSGRVQGVYFRQDTAKQAGKFGVSGWVRNLNNGKVEAVFEGEKDTVEKIVNWIKKGPLLAKVSDFKVDWQEYRGEFNSFEIKH